MGGTPPSGVMLTGTPSFRPKASDKSLTGPLTAAFMPLREAGYATVVASVLLCLWVSPPERALILALGLGLLFAALGALRRVIDERRQHHG